VKSSKRQSIYSEYAGEEGIDSHTPEMHAKQLKVFQRRESPSSKTMKSWVAERVCWNGGRGGGASSEVISGNLNTCVVFEEKTKLVGSELGDHEELGCLGGMGNQEEEISGAEGYLSQLEVEVSPGKLSPVSKKLNLVAPGGEDKVDQVRSLENTAVLEVFRRRDVLSQGNSKVLQRDSVDFIEGDLAETSLQGGAYDQGVGQSSEENSFVESTLKKSMEVSNRWSFLGWSGRAERGVP
jgi:hypothetical protein